MCLLQRVKALEGRLSKDQEGVKARGKSHTGGQYTSWYFTDRWSNLNSSVFSFSVTTPTVGYSGDSE